MSNQFAPSALALRREYENVPLREIPSTSRRMGKREHALASVRGEIGRAIEDMAAGQRTEPWTALWIAPDYNVRITVTREPKR